MKNKEIYDELEKIGEISKNFALTYEITEEQKLSFHFGWETETKGLWIIFYKDQKPNGILFALPLTSIKTNTYAPYYLGGTPTAANLIMINDKIMLFSSEENSPSGDFLQKISTKEEPISGILPMCNLKRRGVLIDAELNDPACVDTPASHSREEIIEEVFGKMPDILAIGICTSGYPEKEIIIKDNLH